MFRLTAEEKKEVVANCDHFQNLKYSPYFPHAFTEHGALMLANVLNTGTAIHASVQIVRAFVRLREIAISHTELSFRIDELEKKYDKQFQVVFEALRQLMAPLDKGKRHIGFIVKGKTDGQR